MDGVTPSQAAHGRSARRDVVNERGACFSTPSKHRAPRGRDTALADTSRRDRGFRLPPFPRSRPPLRLELRGRGPSRVGGPYQGLARSGTRRLRVLQQRRDGLRAEECTPSSGARLGLTVAHETPNGFAPFWCAPPRDASVMSISSGGHPMSRLVRVLEAAARDARRAQALSYASS